MATTAYIMIETNIGMVKDVAKSLRAVPGVGEVDVVIGPYDIIATITAPDMNGVSDLLASQVHKINGVNRTFTCMSLNRD
ncbi:MAG: Lrp/AsnC ligand binding domain-containing protein [Chloroflexi bacterium]|nr:Lrp/AsnC ligand binding domain-containing protein [Chloroflexota bacterium]